MKSIKRKILALILSISSVSGFSIGAMKRTAGKLYPKQQTYAKFEGIEIPKDLYGLLEEEYIDQCNGVTNSGNQDKIVEIMDAIENKISIFKAFEENNMPTSDDLAFIEEFKDYLLIESDYGEISEFMPALKNFEFFAYYKRGKNKKLIELGLIYNDKEDKKILKLKSYNKGMVQPRRYELNVMPLETKA